MYNFYGNINKICTNQPSVPLFQFKKHISSPIDYFRDEILNTLKNNRFFYIASENLDIGILVI